LDQIRFYPQIWPKRVSSNRLQLAKYWKDDQRVSVVKLVIQVAKMLAEPGKQDRMRFRLEKLSTFAANNVY
jgi:hypothetical protein